MQHYRKGDHGTAVAEIRAKLHSLGLLAEVSARYDDETERAVRAFQQSRGLVSDGVVGPETYRTLDEARWQLGDRVLYHQVVHPLVGDDVVALQTWLADRGFDVGRCDGIFGPRTAAAVQEFQRNVGLPADGTVGALTRRAIASLARAVAGGRPVELREHEALYRGGRTPAGRIVVLDPAHGGTDPGWAIGGQTEAEIAYDVASRVEGRLAALGALPFLTRSADAPVSIRDRAEFANAAEADLYVALHVDGAPSPRCNGVAAYHYGGSAAGARLADLVQREIVARTDLLDCRVHPKSWEALRLTRMPAVQIDTGYLTNPHDAARLGDPAFRDAVAEGIAAGIQRLYLPPEDDPGTGQLRLPALTPAPRSTPGSVPSAPR